MKSASVITLALIPVRMARYSDPLEIIVSLELLPVPWAIVSWLNWRLSSIPSLSEPSVKSVMVSAAAKVLPPSPTRSTMVSDPTPE